MWERPLLKWQELRRLHLLSHSRIIQVFSYVKRHESTQQKLTPHKLWRDAMKAYFPLGSASLCMFRPHICITEEPSMMKKESDEWWHTLMLEGSMHITVMFLLFSWLWNLSGIKETRGIPQTIAWYHNHKRKHNHNHIHNHITKKF